MGRVRVLISCSDRYLNSDKYLNSDRYLIRYSDRYPIINSDRIMCLSIPSFIELSHYEYVLQIQSRMLWYSSEYSVHIQTVL